MTFYDWDILSLLFMILLQQQQKQNLAELEKLNSLRLQIHLYFFEWSTGVSFHI